MPHDVFISHSSQDKPVADAVCAALEGAAIRCWIAPRDVQPGRSFAGEITRAIQRSNVMVLIFSAYSNTSEQVLREVQLAANSHLHIVQFRIADVLPNDDLEYYLSTPHWLDALTPPLEGHLDRLQNSIKALLQLEKGEPASTPTAATMEEPAPPPPAAVLRTPLAPKKPEQSPLLTRRVMWMAVAAAAVLIGATAFFPIYYSPKDRVLPQRKRGFPSKVLPRPRQARHPRPRLRALARLAPRCRRRKSRPQQNPNQLVFSEFEVGIQLRRALRSKRSCQGRPLRKRICKKVT
jgi:TIR domain